MSASDRLFWAPCAFPGRAAFDMAVSRQLLAEVAVGGRGASLRLYRPDDVVAFSTRDLRRKRFSEAVRASREAGFDVALRLAGGSAAVFHRETLAFAWCTPERESREGIGVRFERMARLVASALSRLGVEARVGEVPGEYCPGAYSVNAGGSRKLMGVGQRIVRGAAHVGGVIVVGGSDRLRGILEPVYAALDLDFEPSTAGAVEDVLGPTSVETVRDALLAELARESELVETTLDARLVEAAARFERSHRIEGPATDPHSST